MGVQSFIASPTLTRHACVKLDLGTGGMGGVGFPFSKCVLYTLTHDSSGKRRRGLVLSFFIFFPPPFSAHFNFLIFFYTFFFFFFFFNECELQLKKEDYCRPAANWDFSVSYEGQAARNNGEFVFCISGLPATSCSGEHKGNPKRGIKLKGNSKRGIITGPYRQKWNTKSTL